MAWPSAARAATTPSFTLVHQDPVAALTAAGTAHVGLSVRLAHTDAHAEIQLSLYPRLITRGGLTPILNGSSPGTTSVSTTGNLKITCDTAKVVRLSVTLFTHSPAGARGPCVSHAARLRLPCAGAACDGVYPLSYSVTNAGVATTEWSMVAVRVARVATPLHLDLVYSLDPSSLAHPTRTAPHPRRAVAPPDAAHHAHGGLPHARRDRHDARAAPGAVANGAEPSLASPLHRAVVAPPGDVDFAGSPRTGSRARSPAAQPGVGAAAHVDRALRRRPGRRVRAPVARAPGRAGAPRARARSSCPSRLLATPLRPRSTWGAPFHVAGARRVRALATDQGLSGWRPTRPSSRGRRAALTLDTLRFLHFEAPNAPAVRTVVIGRPGRLASAGFVTDLLARAGRTTRS